MKFGRKLIKNDYTRLITTVDGQTNRKAKNNRAPPTFVDRALKSIPLVDLNKFARHNEIQALAI